MNVREKRPGGRWKQKALEILIQRDGALCAQCGAEYRREWAAFGEWTSLDWGEWPRDPMWLGHYTAIRLRATLEVDHKLPLSDGGMNDIDNLWLLCRECHKAKTIAEHSARALARARAA